MKTTILATGLLVAALFVAVPASADPGNGHSWWGLCNAWNANEKGRENGNAENSNAFQALQQEAEDQGYDSVEEFCAEFGGAQKPGNGKGQGSQGSNRPF